VQRKLCTLASYRHFLFQNSVCLHLTFRFTFSYLNASAFSQSSLISTFKNIVNFQRFETKFLEKKSACKAKFYVLKAARFYHVLLDIEFCSYKKSLKCLEGFNNLDAYVNQINHLTKKV